MAEGQTAGGFILRLWHDGNTSTGAVAEQESVGRKEK
jgi:hypothetical protein